MCTKNNQTRPLDKTSVTYFNTDYSSYREYILGTPRDRQKHIKKERPEAHYLSTCSSDKKAPGSRHNIIRKTKIMRTFMALEIESRSTFNTYFSVFLKVEYVFNR